MVPFGRRRDVVVTRRGHRSWSPPCASGRAATRPAASASASGSPGWSPRACWTPDSLAGQDEALTAVRKSKEYQQLGKQAWPRVTPEALVEELFKNRAG